MEKNLIKTIRTNLSAVFSIVKKYGKSSFKVDYDKEADVLYISFGPEQKATDSEIFSDDIILRKKGKEIVGITLLHASDVLKK